MSLVLGGANMHNVGHAGSTRMIFRFSSIFVDARPWLSLSQDSDSHNAVQVVRVFCFPRFDSYHQGPMRFQFLQRVVVFFCLVAFGAQALLGAGIVRCTDIVTGASRLEWNCTPESPAICNPPVVGRPVATDDNLVAVSGTCLDTPWLAEIDARAVRQDLRVNVELLGDLFLSSSPSAELPPPSFLACSAPFGSSSFLPAFSYSQSIVLLI